MRNTMQLFNLLYVRYMYIAFFRKMSF